MYYNAPDNIEIRPFTVFCPLQKATGEPAPGSERTVYGPVASETEDFDGETAERAGIIKGLDMFERLGGTVDWDHLWPQTHNADFIIGKGTHFKAQDGRPWLKTELRKGNKYADGVLGLLNDGMRVGHSIYGTGVKDGKVIKSTQITMVTIAPQPKGFDMFLQKEAPGQSLYAVAKGIMSDGHVDGLEDNWLEVPRSAVDFINPSIENLQKALLTGAGVVLPGAEGGAALRTQFFMGANKAANAAWDGDDLETAPNVNRPRRAKKQETPTPEHPGTPVKTGNLSKALSHIGAGNPDALAVALAQALINKNTITTPRRVPSAQARRTA